MSGSGIGIEARGLSRQFGGRMALQSLDLSIPPSSTYALLGANGAGKTTFVRLVAGLLLPSEGSLRVGDLSPARQPGAVQRVLGFVMETSRLYPELTVRGFLRFVAGARGLTGADREAAIERSLARFGLEDVTRRRVGNLSKGFLQRVSLAQGFLHDPPLVVVDEPTSGLDPVQREEVQLLLETLRGQRTILLCTHDLAEARRLASRAAVLRDGRLVAEDETETLLGAGDPLPLFRTES